MIERNNICAKELVDRASLDLSSKVSRNVLSLLVSDIVCMSHSSILLLKLAKGTLRDKLSLHFKVLSCFWVIICLQRLVVKQSFLLINYLGINHVLLVQRGC